MKRKVLACAMSAMCALSMLPATALATTGEPTSEPTAMTASEDAGSNLVPAGDNAGGNSETEASQGENETQGQEESGANLTVDGVTTPYPTAQDAINAAVNGGTITLLQDALGGLSFSDDHDLVVDCNGRRVGQVGFINSNTSIELKNAKFNMTSGDTININAGGINKNITISGCTFTLEEGSDAPWTGIYIQNSADEIKILDNTFVVNRQNADGFHCIGLAWWYTLNASNVTISKNTMICNSSEGDSLFIVGGQNAYDKVGGKEIQRYGIQNMVISKNHVSYPNDKTNDQYAILLSNVNNLKVIDNSFYDCQVGVFLWPQGGLPTKDVFITGNEGDAAYVAYLGDAVAGDFTANVSSPGVIGGISNNTKYITVVFDAGGGTCDVKSKVLSLNDGSEAAAGKLPTPTYPGSYQFLGWFTESGDPVSADTQLSQNTTLYAHWAYVGPVGHSVTVAPAENGTVELAPTFAYAGDKVTVTATPDEGYEVSSVEVTDASGKEVAVSANADGTWTFEMPSSQATVEVSFSKAAWESPFADVAEGDWFYPAVQFAVEGGYMRGYAPGYDLFGPYDVLTRGQMVQVLYNAEGCPGAAYARTFSDVPEGSTYADAVEWAASAGVAEGYEGAGEFGPDDPMTREQMAAFMCRYAQLKGADVSADPSALDSYPDAGEVSGWAQAEMAWAVGSGVIHGVGGSELQPGAASVRAYVAQMVMNYFGGAAAE